jgi:hypothetical protein
VTECQTFSYLQPIQVIADLQLASLSTSRRGRDIKIDIFSIFSPRLLAQNFVEGKFLDTTEKKNTFLLVLLHPPSLWHPMLSLYTYFQ